MNCQTAIDRHRAQLLRIVGTLFAMIGLAEGAAVERVSKPLCLAILRLLRPAESAVRRLIVLAARGLVVKPPLTRSKPEKPIISGRGKGGRHRPMAFQLFDPFQRFTTRYRFRRHPMPSEGPRPVPRVRVIDVGFDPRVPLFRNAAPVPAPLPAPEARFAVACRLATRLPQEAHPQGR